MDGSKFTLPADFAKHYRQNSPGNRQIERETIFQLLNAAVSAQVPGFRTGLSSLFPGPDQDFDVRSNPRLPFDIHKDPLAFYVPGGSIVAWAFPVTDFHRPGEVRMSSLSIEIADANLQDELLRSLADQVMEASGGVFRLHTNMCREVYPPDRWAGIDNLAPHSALFLDQRISWLGAEQWGLALANVCAALVGSLNLWGALKIQALNISRICRIENGNVQHSAPRDAFSALVGGDGTVRYAYGELGDKANIWAVSSEIERLEQWRAAS